MGSVGTPVIRRIVEVAEGPVGHRELLASVGLSADADPATWAAEEPVAEEAYYALLERAAGDDDHALPMRYGAAIRPDDIGALGLAMKTAPTVLDALHRLERYILVLSDTLEYESIQEPWGMVFALNGRPHHRRGASLANECALAAITSFLREVTGPGTTPREVSFRHPPPASDQPHRDYFGCRVTFGAPVDGLHLTTEQLSQRTALGDEGLSRYLLSQLDELKAGTADRSLVAAVRGAIADALPDGQPSKSQIARRLGMSERTLHRRLADDGESFQSIATQARRDAAESLLRSSEHNLAEIAFLTGFSDQTSFTRAFRRWTGRTPAAFRGSQEVDASTSAR